MRQYAISCDMCGSYEQGVAYRNEAIQHTHAWTGSAPAGSVRITVTR